MTKPVLQYKDRGHGRTLLLVPGWGFDDRIFEPLNLPFNYLMFTDPDMATVEEVVLAGRHGPLAMMGWSQGGVALAGLAQKYPDQVTQLILVGVRLRYPAEGLNEIKGLLLRSRPTYLKCFYKACLGKADRAWFQQTLQKDYLARFTQPVLEAGLDWLAQVSLDVAALEKVASITLVHGSDDQVAPVQETRVLAAKLSQARYCEIPGASHAVFLHPAFSECVT